jgi:hypothetical protein
MRGWMGMLRNLNASLIAVWRAEIAALLADLSASGRRLRSGLLLLALAASLLVLLIGTLVFTVIAALSLVLPLWGAALAVAGLLALAMAILAWVGLSRLHSVESPAHTVRRRLDDHLDWWNNRLEDGRRGYGEPGEPREPREPREDDELADEDRE